MLLRLLIAGRNADGEPDLFPLCIQCTNQQYEQNKHYETAMQYASENGYEALIAYDENDVGMKSIVRCFDWDRIAMQYTICMNPK